MLRGLKFAKEWSGVIALALVLASAASAATGGSLKLGARNAAPGTTVLRNTGLGSALDLRVKPGEPPLKVNSGVLVPRLNAARLGGKPPSAFAPAAGSTQYAPASGSPNYLSSAAPQILLTTGGRWPGDADGELFLDATVEAPTGGTITVLAVGHCSWTEAYTMELSIGSKSSASGSCTASLSETVAAGSVSVKGTLSSRAPIEFIGAVLVFFDPAEATQAGD